MSDTPAFDRDTKDHVFAKGEKIYVIDENDFDIYAAELGEVTEDSWEVKYPEYPDDNFTAKSTERFLIANETNTKIFEEQEIIRAQNAADEADEEAAAKAEEEEEEEEEKMPKRRGKSRDDDDEAFNDAEDAE